MEEQQTMEAVSTDAPNEGHIAEPAQPEGDSTEQAVAEAKAAEAFYEMDGERIPASQLKEWRAGYMKDADYRRKTSEHAEQKREWEDKYGKMDPYMDTINYLQDKPEILEKVNQLIQESYEGTDSTGNSPALTQQVQQIQQKLEDIELDKSINKLKANPMFEGKLNSREEENEFLRFVSKNKMSQNIELAAKSYFYDKDIAGAKLNGQEQVAANLKKKGAIPQPINATGAGMMNSPKIDSSKQNMDQIFEGVGNELFGNMQE